MGATATTVERGSRAAGEARRARRSASDEFEARAVALVLKEGGSVPQVAKNLDLTESALRSSVERARADAGEGRLGVLVSEERGARGADTATT